MALSATIHRIKLQLSDADRGVYEGLDLRVAQHPSETERYLVTRVLAYALCYEEGIEWSHGLSHDDEPAAWVKTPDGRTLVWIEVGSPSAERLHRASKACQRVVVFTQHDPELVLREARRTKIHRADAIELYAPARELIDELSGRLQRNTNWDVVRSGGQLYVTVDGHTVEGTLERHPLVAV